MKILVLTALVLPLLSLNARADCEIVRRSFVSNNYYVQCNDEIVDVADGKDEAEKLLKSRVFEEKQRKLQGEHGQEADHQDEE